MKPKHRKLEHYLMTLRLNNAHHMHGYVMCAHPPDIEGVMGKMFECAEEKGLSAFPVAMSTRLSDSIDLVRKVMNEVAPASSKLMDEATDFHFTIIATPIGSAEDVKLMALH